MTEVFEPKKNFYDQNRSHFDISRESHLNHVILKKGFWMREHTVYTRIAALARQGFITGYSGVTAMGKLIQNYPVT